MFAGDLKLVEKPQPLTMAPHDFCNIKANVKVTSTENGIIFGNIGTVGLYIKFYYASVLKKKRWFKVTISPKCLNLSVPVTSLSTE